MSKDKAVSMVVGKGKTVGEVVGEVVGKGKVVGLATEGCLALPWAAGTLHHHCIAIHPQPRICRALCKAKYCCGLCSVQQPVLPRSVHGPPQAASWSRASSMAVTRAQWTCLLCTQLHGCDVQQLLSSAAGTFSSCTGRWRGT